MIYFALSTSRDGGALWGNAAYGYDASINDFLPTTGSLNITAAMNWWELMVLGIAQGLAPVGKMSVFHGALTVNGLSSLRLAYYGESSVNAVNEQTIMV